MKLTLFIPCVLKNLSSSQIPVVDSEFLVEEVDTFLVSEDSIPPGIESDLDSEGGIVFLDNLLNDDPIPDYERFTFDIEPDAPVLTIPLHLSFGLFSRFSPTLRILLYFSPSGVKTPFLTPASSLRACGISSGWNFHVRILKKWTKSKQKRTKPNTGTDRVHKSRKFLAKVHAGDPCEVGFDPRVEMDLNKHKDKSRARI
ncbi:hypothetical protein Tco_0321486 [Tanacetum coccineum]